jgi:hypothetical protein
MNKTRKRHRAGRLERSLNLNSSEILGAGGYGIVFSSGRKAVKLLYDLDACKDLYREAKLQERARELLEGIVRVPQIYSYMNHSVLVKGTQYLCGIEMERIPVLPEFDEPLHMLLGFSDPDEVNRSWGRSIAKPVGPENPSRGFFAGLDLLEEILEADGLTLEGVAATMGIALCTLLDGGILPNDLEWIYGGSRRIYLIDFGLCEFGTAEPEEFLNRQGSSGLRGDIYIPQKEDRGYREFLEGFLGYPPPPA